MCLYVTVSPVNLAYFFSSSSFNFESSLAFLFFFQHLSSDFCRRYLPKSDALMTLEDEDGQKDYANYKSRRCGLSGGWGRFATDHRLKVGDIVVFELVEMTKFKAESSLIVFFFQMQEHYHEFIDLIII
jgi:hypothetical protein